jgi:hypothetical protein
MCCNIILYDSVVQVRVDPWQGRAVKLTELGVKSPSSFYQNETSADTEKSVTSPKSSGGSGGRWQRTKCLIGFEQRFLI